MRFTIAAIFSAVAAIASAYTPPTGDPSGNPIIHPGLNELIPAGQSYEITWTPTTTGNVAILFLQGPPTNVIPILTIVDSTPNQGSYTWQVPADLTPDTTNYAIEIIVEGTGQYQYSAQCGVSNANAPAAASSSTTDSGAAASTTYSGSAATSTMSPDNSTWTTSMTSAPDTAAATTTYAPVTAGSGNFSSPVLTPTNSMTVPSSLYSYTYTPTGTYATPSPTSAQTGAAVVANAVRKVGTLAVAAGLVGFLAL